MTTVRAAVVLVLLSSGCNAILGIGDVKTQNGSIDASSDAPPGTPDGPPADGRFTGPVALAAASDFSNPGQAGVLDVGTGMVTMDALPGSIGRDPVVRFTGGYFVVINRFGDNGVIVIDPNSLARVKMIPTGAGTNPQDAAIVNGKVFVPTYGSAGVQVYDLVGGAQPRLVDLSGFDPDGLPDCVSAYATPNRVFVACGLLDASFQARGPGKVAVIDPASETVTTSFDLPAKNPFGLFAPTVGGGVGGELLIATVPSFTDFSMGCIARVKITGTPAANGCLASNQAMGGYASSMSVNATGNTVYAATSNGLKQIGYPGGGVTAVTAPNGYTFTNVAGCSNGDVVTTLTGPQNGGFQVLPQVFPSPKSFGIAPQNTDALACN